MTEIPRELARLAAELRVLRDRRKLTLSALAAESAFSKSSWQRYFTGHALAPWPAVRRLCQLVNEPEPRLRALWELAESSWNRRGAVESATPLAPAPAHVEKRLPRTSTHDSQYVTPSDSATTGQAVREPASRHRGRWRTGAAASATVTLFVVLITLAADGWGWPRSSFYAWPTGDKTCSGKATDDALAHEITVLHLASRDAYGMGLPPGDLRDLQLRVRTEQ
ncbi:helix-turn-helix domain-containing protein [Streptomyces sp. NBC_00988]|uniref:helix-turn-helix domain-containing protein n=1 Tax=Streptomyces sp. NBC_00988 TaxID=2903704 RepID=UPI00386EC500|nr:helix-turn-helix domain-containing protein [Streptomyces sp. NBC_00988]